MKEYYIIGYLKAYFMPLDWKRFIFIILIIVISLLIIFTFTPILFDIIIKEGIRITPSKKLRLLIS